MAQKTVRVIEGGGKGFRRTDVCNGEIGDVLIPKSTMPIRTFEELVAFAGRDLAQGTVATAYSVAGIIKGHSLVEVSPNLHFLDGADLGKLTKEATGLPTYVANDMEASVTGMHVLFPELNYFLGITWSSGIGIRIFKDGKILSDSEGGHLCIDPSPFAQLCGCGRRGCAEAIVAGKGMGRRIVAELEARGINAPQGKSVFALLDEDYLVGEAWALDTYWIITTGLGLYLTILQNIFHLPAIVWKGTFAKKSLALEGVEEAIRATMRERLMNPAWEKDLKFYIVPGPTRPNLMEDGDSFLGAAQLALDFFSL